MVKPVHLYMKTWVIACALVMGCVSISSAGVDRNSNGMSDVWELVYSASALLPGGDADGDGFSNLQEAIAGTNPFDANSHPDLHFNFLSPSTTTFTWDSIPGKRYIIQSRTNL